MEGVLERIGAVGRMTEGEIGTIFEELGGEGEKGIERAKFEELL